MLFKKDFFKGTIFFVDPYSEVERNALPIEQRRTYIPGSNLNTLFSNYGAYVEPGMIVGDRISGRKVTIGRSQNSRVITYVLWLSLTKDLMNPNNLITNELESILTNTPGGIVRSKDAKSKFEILYSSNADSMLIERFKIQFRPDPTLLLSEFQSDQATKNLAVSLTGQFNSAYIDGPPMPEDGGEPFINRNHKIETKTGNILIFADTDMLSNSIWTQKQDNFGKETFTPISDNGSLVINSTEYLAGGGELIALRTRGTSMRPFIVVEELQKKAETAYRETEKSLQNDLTLTENKLRDLESKRLEAQHALNPINEELQQARLNEREANVVFEQCCESINTSSIQEETIEQSLKEDADLDQLEESYINTNNRIERLGPVNLAAISELETIRERQAYIQKQVEDLEEASKTLLDAIHKIDRETREKLKATYQEVNQNFNDFFKTLFNGGRAQLELLGQEILDTGLQVVAQPPGKKNQTIHLLSGGEKALTAIALVFALFKLNPSPFCLMDEVDAPLDDSNAQRFCDVVKSMAKNTQFLFVSHNKLTMEIAEQLIGVTMQEAGVSRIVEVDLQDLHTMELVE